MGQINYVAEDFSHDGKEYKKGDTISHDEFVDIDKSLANSGKVAKISHEIAERLKMRDVTPNKPADAATHDDLVIEDVPGKTTEVKTVGEPLAAEKSPTE